MSFRYAIVGRGAIGLGLAQLLSKQDCTLLTRDYSGDSTKQNMFTASDIDHNNAPIRASVQRLDIAEKINWQCFDIVILPVKFYHLRNLIMQLQPTLPETLPLLLLQNGLGGHELLTAALPNNPLYLGSTTDAIVKVDDKSIHIHARGELVIGSTRQVEPPAVLKSLIKAHPKGRWDNDILSYLYQKLAINAVINPLSAKYRCRNGDIMRYPKMVEGIKQEVFALYKALSLDIDLDKLSEFIDSVISLTANNYSSMYQDVMCERPTEIDSILGVILTKAAEQKLQLPLIQALFNEIKHA